MKPFTKTAQQRARHDELDKDAVDDDQDVDDEHVDDEHVSCGCCDCCSFLFKYKRCLDLFEVYYGASHGA